MCIYQDVCAYMKMYVNIQRCMRLYKNVCVYTKMYVNIPRCMCIIVSKWSLNKLGMFTTFKI